MVSPEHGEGAVAGNPCYQPYLPHIDGDESFQLATLYGSIFPAVWNFQLALHTRGYGTCITTLHLHREDEVRRLLGIPETYVQGCLPRWGVFGPGTDSGPPSGGRVGEVVVAGPLGRARALEWVGRHAP